MVTRISQWITLLLFAFAGFNISSAGVPALSPAAALTDYKVQRWTTEDGLPQGRIACLCQTRDGYLWLGTWFGLARFDGVKFTMFNKENTSALRNNAINALAEDTDGALWIGTGDGLVKYNGGKFTRFTTADGLPDREIWQVAASKSGGIWLQSGDRIVRCQHDQFVTVRRCPEGETVCAIQEGADGRLNLFLSHQWLTLSPESDLVQTNFLQPHERNGEWMLGAGLGNSPGLAYAGSVDGLRQLKAGQTNVVFVGGWQGNHVGFLMRDSAGGIWAQSRAKGLRRFDGNTWQPVDLGLFRSDVIGALQDAQGNVWLGTVDGLIQLQFQKVRTFTTRDGLPDDNVWTVCQSTDGIIWAGTDRGLVMIRSNQVETVDLPPANPRQVIHCVWPERSGGVWVAANEAGVFKIKDGSMVKQLHDLGLVGSLWENKTGRMWIGTFGQVYCFQDGQVQPPPPGLDSLRNVHSMTMDGEDNFWFGTHDHVLARWHGSQFSVYTTRDGLPAQDIWCIHADSDGILWLGTEKGLVRFAHGKFLLFSPGQRMPAGTVNWVLEDDDGCLWCSTLHGIYRVERAALNAVAEGRATAVQPFILGTADGMKNPESNGEVQPAGWKARDGRLWFPTGKGLVVIDPKQFPATETPPVPVVESFRADGRELFQPNDARIKIAAGRGHLLKVCFTACDLAAPGQVRFQTRLAGLSSAWNEPTPNREEDYFNLAPGDYRFEVRAADHHGVWNTQPAVLAFTLKPCFWQTWWFYGACTLGIMGLAGAIQAYRLQWQQRLHRVEQQRAVASERTRIARDLHDDLGTALTGMALELDVIGREAKTHPSLVERLGKASQHTRHLAERMREVVWVVNPRCDNLRSLADFLEDQAALLLRAAGLKVQMDFPMELPDLPMTANVRHQLALSVREAFSNLVRHAHATEARVKLELSGGRLFIRIRDNGCGFEPHQHLNKEHGIINMSVRLEEIGGSFECVSAPGQGTTILFSVPMPAANH